MAQKELGASIKIGVNQDSSFDTAMTKLRNFETVVTTISDKLAQVLDQSLDVYKDYETNMLQAKGALTTQYKDVNDLNRVMKNLDEHAQSWAASTIFHTSDVSEAISEAAHAGWSYEQMLEGIPAAMNLAQAGNIDLSTAIDYVIKSLNGLDADFNDSGKIIDQWAKAANSSATNIDEIGQAITKMGATTQFADTTEQLFTLLSVLADTGATGTQAGTLLRNSMIRLIAPTKKASELFESLDVTAGQLADDDGAIQQAYDKLSGKGFSVYDAQGKLKPMLQIYKELYSAVQDMNQEERYNVLTTIFPTRTITGALAILQSAANDYDGMLGNIIDSEGYAAKVASIQMSGLMGSSELLASKVQELQRKTGEALAPDYEKLATFVGNIVQSLIDLPKDKFDILINGLDGIVAVGAGTAAIAGVMKLASIMNPMAAAAIAAGAGLGMIYEYMTQTNDAYYDSKFGDMQIDLETLQSKVGSVQTIFDEALTAASEWESKVNDNASTYADLSQKLSSALLTDVLSGKTLTQPQKEKLKQYGEDIIGSVLDGIRNERNATMTLLDTIFGQDGHYDETEIFTEGLAFDYYQSLYGEANKIGQELRDQFTAALQDDQLDEAERLAIQNTLGRYNEIVAEINGGIDKQTYYQNLYKSQHVTGDSIAEWASTLATMEQEDLARQNTEAGQLWAQMRALFDWGISNNREILVNGKYVKATEDQWSAWETWFKESYMPGNIDTIKSYYQNYKEAAFDAAMNDSTYSSDAWEYYKRLFGYSVINWENFAEDPLKLIDWIGKDAQAVYGAKGLTYDELRTYGGGYTDQGMRKTRISQNMRSLYDKGNPWLMVDQLDSIIKKRDEAQARIDANDYSVAANLFGQGIDKDYDTVASLNTQIENLVKQIPQYLIKISIQFPDSQDLVPEYMQQYQLEANAGITIPATLQLKTASGVDASSFSGIDIKSLFPGGLNAQGGFSSVPAIFGEAGLEAAIPVAHTDRTASLLAETAAASGFTWQELSALSGSGSGGNTVTVQFSPTIYANDATGVDNTLSKASDDLKRMLQQALKDMDRTEEVEVYV